MGFVPIHPALVHLPIAFVLLSVLSDFFARISKFEPHRAVCRSMGFWSLVAAAIGGALSVAAGYWDAGRDRLQPETGSLVRLHLTIGWLLTAALVVLLLWRWLIWHRGQMTINTTYLAAGTLVLGLTAFQGWFGSEMVYSYGAGVAAAGQGAESPEIAQERLATVRNLLGAGPIGVGGAESPSGTNQSNASGKPSVH